MYTTYLKICLYMLLAEKDIRNIKKILIVRIFVFFFIFQNSSLIFNQFEMSIIQLKTKVNELTNKIAESI